MLFPMGHTITYRVERAGKKRDPYNPDATVEDWNNPDTFRVAGFLSQTSSTEIGDGPRAQLTDTAIFTIPDPEADIRRGDVIVDQMGRRWEVVGHPARDQSPFTGWHPTTVCQLNAWQG